MKVEPPYALAFDCGTTALKATLVDTKGSIAASATTECILYSPQPGYAEQDPVQLWNAVKLAAKTVLKRAKVSSFDVAGIGFCGTMGGALPVDKHGEPLRKVMLYADTRAINQSEWLKEHFGLEALYLKTGNPVSPVPSLAKWMWIKENEPKIFSKTCRLIQVSDFLVFKLTDRILTDLVDASATMAFDLRKKQWDNEILNLTGIPLDMMPPPHLSTEIAGELSSKCAEELHLKRGTPVIVGCGDTGALLVGVGAVKHQTGTIYLGAAAEIDLTTFKPSFDPKLRVPVRCHAIHGKYFNSATALTSGTALKWFKEQFCEPKMRLGKKSRKKTYRILDEQAEKVPSGSRGLIFLPYLLGERTPLWDPKARGAFLGISLSNQRIDFYRSILEGVAFSLRHILEVFEDMGVTLSQLRASGGGAKSPLWTQIVTDVLGLPCTVVRNPTEVSSIGVAICIETALGIHSSVEAAAEKMIKTGNTYSPNMKQHAIYNKLFDVYKGCYPALMEVMQFLADFEAKRK